MNWRSLLLPFSPIYGGITGLRNIFFNKGILKSTRFDVPTLVIGNLSTGGTGKTPHTEYFLTLFGDRNAGVISRGYGRKSKGFLWVKEDGDADTFGDEPLQIKRKFPENPVAVCEERILAVPEFMAEYPDTDLLIFDDAFQHRYIDGHANVLLTVYGDLFSDDRVLPAGNLRESRKGARRANCIVVTKCPPSLPEENKTRIRKELGKYSSAPVFFSSYRNGIPRNKKGIALEPEQVAALKSKNAFVFSAIAGGSKWATGFLDLFRAKTGELTYRDHHSFSRHDVALLKKQLAKQENAVVISTEKDMMRLLPLLGLLEGVELIYFPIEVDFAGREEELKQLLLGLLYGKSIVTAS